MYLGVILTVLPLVIFGAAGWLLFVWMKNRRLGGPGQSSLYRRALRSTDIPEGADTSVWLSRLRSEERREKKQGWKAWVPSVLIVALILAVNTDSALDDADTGLGRALAVLVPLGVVGAFAAWMMVSLRRRTRRAHALRAALERIEDPPPRQ